MVWLPHGNEKQNEPPPPTGHQWQPVSLPQDFASLLSTQSAGPGGCGPGGEGEGPEATPYPTIATP
eukprot:4717226-Prymnesium_polylepis.2